MQSTMFNSFEVNGTVYEVKDCRLPQYDDPAADPSTPPASYWEPRHATHTSPHVPTSIQYVICHCLDARTEADIASLFLQYKVSAHFAVTPEGAVLCFVSPSHVAYHAGLSAFDDWHSTPSYASRGRETQTQTQTQTQTRTQRGTETDIQREIETDINMQRKTLNYSSIGIEFLSPGYAHGGKNWYHFEPFSDRQRVVGTALIQHLVQTFSIDPDKVLGHSDVAPFRRNAETNAAVFAKSDPGPTFFWPDLVTVGISMPLPNTCSHERPSVDWIQNTLRIIGYCLTPLTGVIDTETAYVIVAFQLHFVPHKFLDEAYAETAIESKSYDLLMDERTVGALESLRAYKNSKQSF